MFEFLKKKETAKIVVDTNDNDEFDIQQYEAYNNQMIDEFLSRYDLSTIEGILSIPISEAKRYPDGGKSVVYMPEQILNRKATEYKKNKQYDLAIACLAKANEMYEPSAYGYVRDDYERLVNMQVEAGYYNEAKKTHAELDKTVGKYVDFLWQLMKKSCSTIQEKKKYKESIIDKRIEEDRDREIYYFLLENYNKIAPKSFGGFRKMKRSNSENYKKIVDVLLKDGYTMDNIRFWY